MTNPPAGWFQDPENPTQQRWWSGESWAAPGEAPNQPTPHAHRSRTKRSAIGIVVCAVIALILLVSGQGGTLLVILGLAAAGIGGYAALTGSASRFSLRSRKAGAIALAVGLFVTAIGGGANAATHGSGANDASGVPAGIAMQRETSTPAPSPSATPTPVDVVTEVQELSDIPFSAVSVDDAGYDLGFSGITTNGVVGQKATTFKVTTREGVEISREIVAEIVAVSPVDQVTTNGTRVPPPVAAAPVASDCDSNYAGVCVPIASDVDCAGGSGNGPAYVSGPLQVVGSDVYDLDRDGDGIACD